MHFFFPSIMFYLSVKNFLFGAMTLKVIHNTLNFIPPQKKVIGIHFDWDILYSKQPGLRVGVPTWYSKQQFWCDFRGL